MKILVTGSKGFIGQNLVNHLCERHEVIGIDVDDKIPNINEFNVVMHLGAISSTTYSDVDSILNNNLDFSIKLLDLCETHKVHFQYASSASVYGGLFRFSEDGPVAPQSPYAWSKYLFDRYVTNNLHRYSVTVQGFRYFNVYGPHEEHKRDQASPYTKFIKQAKETGTIKLFENSDRYLRDFVHVKDVCVTHEKMMSVKQSGIFNVGSGKTVSFQDVAECIARKYHAKIQYVPMPDQLKTQYQTYTQADLTKLSSYIDVPFIDIRDFINDQKDN